MKKLPAIYSLIIPVFLLIMITGCKKSSDATLALLSTTAVSSIDSTSAIVGGEIFSEGADPVIARGVCWSTSDLPTILNFKTVEGEGTGSFTSSLTGLSKGTLYIARAYATSVSGTAYGQVVYFYTLGVRNMVMPSSLVQTLDASDISISSVTLNGSIDDQIPIENVSFEYGLTDAYGSTIQALQKVAKANTDGSLKSTKSMAQVSATLYGLWQSSLYHFRINVSTPSGSLFGNDMTFMTPASPGK